MSTLTVRNAEWIGIIYFGLLILLAWWRPLPGERSRSVTTYGLAGLAMILLGVLSQLLSPAEVSSILRDWIPAPLILVAYWQAGRFFVEPDRRLQRALLQMDRRWVGWLLRDSGSTRTRRLLLLYCELSYLLCYAMPPLALGALYAVGLRHRADLFWTIILVPTYLSYAMVPFLPTLPPRSLSGHNEKERATAARKLNLWFLRHASIGANTFPSGHVALSFAIAFALLALVPAAGVVGLWVAASITLATVVGRYHYLADGLLAASICVAWYSVAIHAFGI